MFKKVLESISKSLGKPTKPAPAPAAKDKAAPAAPPPPAAKGEAPKEKAPVKPVAKKSAEELCEIEPKMNKEQVRERLKMLYRRHNRAASSLDAKTREEADAMLDAIVQIREKFFGEI